MSFPSNPTDGQTTIQNYILYTYSTSTNSWRRNFNNTVDQFFISGLYQSTASTNGALIVLGGVGIGYNLNVGESVTIGDNLTVGGTVTLSPSAGDVFIEPSLGGTVVIYPSVVGSMDNVEIGADDPRNAYFRIVEVQDTGNSISTNSGALTVAGGVGIGQDLYVGGNIYSNGSLLSFNWYYTSTNYSASSGDRLFVNTSATTVTVVLPLLPSVGDTIEFIDYAGTFGTNNLIFSRNGKKIMGFNENLIIDLDYAANTLVYSGSDQGWKIGVIF